MVLPTADADGPLCACEQRCAPCTRFPTLRVIPIRDLLEWPGMLKNTRDDIDLIKKCDVQSRVDSMLGKFCPLLGCIQPVCPSHSMCSVTYSTLHQLLPIAHDRELNRNIKPTLNNGSLRQRIKKNCNNLCFELESEEYVVRVAAGRNENIYIYLTKTGHSFKRVDDRGCDLVDQTPT